MRKNNFLKITTYAAVFGLIGGMSFEGTTYISNKYINKSSVESSKTTSKSIEKTSTLSSTSTNTSGSDGVSGVSESVLPSIVAIDVKTTQTSTDVFGRTYEQDASGSGSGIIVAQDSKNIYIATNNHVVADASSVSVTFNDKSVYSATVKGTDSDSDLAVVEVPLSKLSADTLSNIKVAKLGDSDKVKVGAQAIAIGNALGYGTSVTVGYISAKALNRTITLEGGSTASNLIRQMQLSTRETAAEHLLIHQVPLLELIHLNMQIHLLKEWDLQFL